MKILSHFKTLFAGIYSSIKRFPLTIIFSASFAAVMVILSEDPPFQEALGKIAMTLALGIPLSLCIKLLFERFNKEKKYAMLVGGYGVSILFLFMYYNFLLKDLSMINVSRYIAVSLALYLGFIFIPYLPKREQFEMYVIKIASNFFITAIYAAILFIGLSAIIFTIDKLLGIKLGEPIYFQIWIIVVFIFAVSYFSALIPLKDEGLNVNLYPKFLKILLLYIVMPLIVVYAAILYIYFGKIMLTRQWPINIVTNLVLWYSAVTAAVLFLITPIKGEGKWPNIFIEYFPKVIIPILAMMFVSIGIRIKAYGITENRYYVVILALWVTFAMLYYSFRKNRKNIILPVSLAVLAIISVFGPLSSFNISKFSQNKRLESLLIRNSMLKDNEIKASSNVSKKDREEISSIITYFNENHSLSEAKYLPSDFKLENMDKVFGFTLEDKYNYMDRYFSFNFRLKDSEGPMDIKDYDYVFDKKSLNSKDNDLEAYYDYSSSVVTIRYKGRKVYSKDLNDFADNLVNIYGANNLNKVLPGKEMTFAQENENIAVKVIFLNMSGRKDDSEGKTKLNGADFYLLVKIKD